MLRVGCTYNYHIIPTYWWTAFCYQNTRPMIASKTKFAVRCNTNSKGQSSQGFKAHSSQFDIALTSIITHFPPIEYSSNSKMIHPYLYPTECYSGLILSTPPLSSLPMEDFVAAVRISAIPVIAVFSVFPAFAAVPLQRSLSSHCERRSVDSVRGPRRLPGCSRIYCISPVDGQHQVADLTAQRRCPPVRELCTKKPSRDTSLQ